MLLLKCELGALADDANPVRVDLLAIVLKLRKSSIMNTPQGSGESGLDRVTWWVKRGERKKGRGR